MILDTAFSCNARSQAIMKQRWSRIRSGLRPEFAF